MNITDHGDVQLPHETIKSGYIVIREKNFSPKLWIDFRGTLMNTSASCNQISCMEYGSQLSD